MTYFAFLPKENIFLSEICVPNEQEYPTYNLSVRPAVFLISIHSFKRFPSRSASASTGLHWLKEPEPVHDSDRNDWT